MHSANVTIADKKNIIPFSEQSFSTFKKSLALQNDKSYDQCYDQLLNIFLTGKLSITFPNQKEYCIGNRELSVKHELQNFLIAIMSNKFVWKFH